MNRIDPLNLPPRVLWLIFGVFAGSILMQAVAGYPMAWQWLVAGDNDDITRWLSIEAWRNGQSWFDMTQYRFLPPEGMQMHWSRYIDAAIAGLYALAAFVLPPQAAAQAVLVLWPSLLLCLLLAIVGRGTQLVLGGTAALVAMIFVMTWAFIRELAFAMSRIDHHNVQILTTTAMVYAMIWPGSPFRKGVIAGLFAAFSLAVGLETLLVVAAAGVVLAVRASFGRDGADARLAGFALALVIGSLLFFAGQTAPANWFVPYCDALAPPILSITWIAALACLIPMAARPVLPHPALRLGATAAISLAGLWLGSDLLSPCLAGPYGTLPVEIQTLITSSITEAQPVLIFARGAPETFIKIILPAAAITALASLFWVRRGKGDATGSATAQMLIFAWLGCIGSLIQMRMILMAAPALPFLAGFVFLNLLQARQSGKRWFGLTQGVGPTLAMIPIAAMVFFSGPITTALLQLTLPAQAAAASSVEDGGTCRNIETLTALDALPQARILTTLNLGAPMVLLTHHFGLTAPYHRSADAFWNGSFPFRDRDLMVKALVKTGAEYLVLCRGAGILRTDVFAKVLRSGDIPDWLILMPELNKELLVYRVIAANLPKLP
ncbi:hypothetical protein [Pseudorhodobacter sp.]|uniref:hypothetical protein n=1 Tax=Pseudorhodobacter sp. TaxID=1934400 RepID=UPI002646FCAA|nr:hypothetical protein [Pseudorhodobacter sp.]MDN5785616.1 hypothetical protein [Pseudorhodobacter sp.]